jgi:hypothetical protein
MWCLLNVGRAQVLAEQRLAEADAAAEAQRAVERQQDAFKQVLKKAALSGATAGWSWWLAGGFAG